MQKAARDRGLCIGRRLRAKADDAVVRDERVLAEHQSHGQRAEAVERSERAAGVAVEKRASVSAPVEGVGPRAASWRRRYHGNRVVVHR